MRAACIWCILTAYPFRKWSIFWPTARTADSLTIKSGAGCAQCLNRTQAMTARGERLKEVQMGVSSTSAPDSLEKPTSTPAAYTIHQRTQNPPRHDDCPCAFNEQQHRYSDIPMCIWQHRLQTQRCTKSARRCVLLLPRSVIITPTERHRRCPLTQN